MGGDDESKINVPAQNPNRTRTGLDDHDAFRDYESRNFREIAVASFVRISHCVSVKLKLL